MKKARIGMLAGRIANMAGIAALATFCTPVAAQVDPARLSDGVRTLASDAFEGREPGTPGEQKTVEWLIARMKAIGVQPGAKDGGWTQTVPLLRTRIESGGSLRFALRDGPMPVEQGKGIYVSTLRADARVGIVDAPIVFVGYGADAPERNWNDFKDVDLTGKVAVFLVNDPDFEVVAEDDAAGRFGDRRMTWYGRWSYKFEVAARRGAVAALIVHDTPGAGYGWDTVKAPGGVAFDIAGDHGRPRLALQGWIEGKTAETLFRKSGLDLASLRVQSRSAGFRPIELAGTRFTANLPVTAERFESRNVLGRIAGSSHADETILFGAHWDAYGIGAPDPKGLTVRPGANDDAMGVIGVLEIARLFAAGPKPQRSLMFGFWTGEERGLLGSEAFMADPAVAPAKMVANVTLDILQTGGPSHDVLLVGDGQNSLEQDLQRVAAAQGRRVTPEALPERGLFYRADHLPFARKGVPTLLLMAISGAPDLVEGGRAAGDAWLQAYMACYHQTCDSWNPTWDLRGAARDVDLAYEIGRSLAMSRQWPRWSEGSEFAPVRATTDKERAATQ